MPDRLPPPPPQGRKPSLDWMAPVELAVDDSYQRLASAQASQKLIRRIADEWRWDLCLPLLVSRRPDGKHFVVDGQHRLAAARMRGDIHVLPCFVRDLDGPAAEAALFVAVNRSRKSMTVLDDFHAAVAAGNDDAVRLTLLISNAGLSVARATAQGQRVAPGEVACIAGLRTALRIYGPDIVGAALTIAGEAFPDEVLDNAAALLGGLIFLFAETRDVDRDRLFEALLSRTTVEWSSFARLDFVRGGPQRARAMRDVLLQAYASHTRAEAA